MRVNMVYPGSNVWIGCDVWKGTERIIMETNDFGQRPQEIK